MRPLFVLLLAVTTLKAASIGNSNIRLDEYSPDHRDVILTQTEEGEYRVMDLQDVRLQKSATVADIHYYLYTKKNKDTPYLIENNDVSELANSKFNHKKRVVFIIHGWNNDYTSSVNTLVKGALLDNADVNVIVVDWGKLANKNYFTARFSVRKIGQFVGQFINNITEKYKKSYKDFVIIGHSLGAHVAGVAGANTKQKVDYIVGLDPASPLFTLHNIDDRLDTTDADFVEIIHTSGGRLGFLSPIGHADYYPNGGTSQPGCFLDVFGSCAHSRSYMYFAESIRDKVREFRAFKCDSYSHFKKGKCNSSESVMGEFTVNKNARGTYYLETKSKEPFAEDFRT
ncbi:lipoprotein lipase-like [Coccinella septempunctata]|uniref:lipoprotein lipase-like n=1 Tax=Coccinella septempunctata TaxID=41139 RepID=UPI001D064755|nr:lipoprotein lipase-like [Coccinella septempunctata]